MSGEATPVACTDTLATQLKTHTRKIFFSSRRETPFIANSASQDQVLDIDTVSVFLKIITIKFLHLIILTDFKSLPPDKLGNKQCSKK